MKILLVWPSVRNAELYNLLPLGLGYLAVNLPKEYQIKLWDGVLNHLANNKITDEIDRFKPDIIGLSVWNFNRSAVCETVNIIVEDFPGLTIVVGGPTVSGYQNRIFDVINADYAFAGEGEKSFCQFLELFASDGLTPKNKKQINGLIYKDEDGKIRFNPPHWENLDKLKYCDYEFINLNQYLANGYYYGIHSNAKRTAPILTTRGCPFTCEYCGARLINGKRVRTRSVESVIAEIKELHEKYQIRGFNIIDDNFTFNIEYAKEVCRRILDLGMKNISFCSPNGIRVEYLDQELLDLMKKAGWEWLFIAPESGSERTLNNMRKMIKLSVVQEKIKLIRDAGLKIFGFFMIGYPEETIADIKMTIDFACQNDFDSAVFTCFQPLVGTPIYERLMASGELDTLPEDVDYYQISYAPKNITLRQMKFWRFWGLFRFYTSSFERFFNALSNYSLKRILIFLKKVLK